MMVIRKWISKLSEPTSILPLAVFRMAFGLLMCFSQLRFIWKGWVMDSYTAPEFHFTYQYFGWIRPFDNTTMYIIVGSSAIFALFIGLGFLYRISTVVFFLSFTYLELIEKTWYLNHYYFASLIAFLLILLPANRNLALDAYIFKDIRLTRVPVWTIFILKLQLAAVYFFGGIAKLKSDWLWEAQPLKIWLKARTDIPFIGGLFEMDFVPYLFSWSGMVYDLAIPFLLWSRRSRPWAYILVIIFHVLTYILFNIGMFPWLMVAGSLIFITAEEWKKLAFIINVPFKYEESIQKSFKTSKMALSFLGIFMIFQFTLPLRHYFLTDNVLWTENGIRFAWHVMVMEKNGFVEFTAVDNKSNRKFTIYPSQYLTVIQEKQMSFQPDMIWQFAQYLETRLNESGTKVLSIYVNSKVALNGRASQTYIDPYLDLLSIDSADDIYLHILALNSGNN